LDELFVKGNALELLASIVSSSRLLMKLVPIASASPGPGEMSTNARPHNPSTTNSFAVICTRIFSPPRMMGLLSYEQRGHYWMSWIAGISLTESWSRLSLKCASSPFFFLKKKMEEKSSSRPQAATPKFHIERSFCPLARGSRGFEGKFCNAPTKTAAEPGSKAGRRRSSHCKIHN
jgi:hypothetical protein